MAYEMYICLNKATYESAIPSELQSQLGWTNYTYDEDGEVESSTVYTPTWKEAAFKGKLGVPRESHDGAYIISVLTKAEAQTLAASGTFVDG